MQRIIQQEFYNKPIQANRLYPDNYQVISCFINKKLFSAGTSDTAIPLDYSEVEGILSKFQVKKNRMNRDISGTTYILFEFSDSNRPNKLPLLYVFNDGRIWLAKDNRQETLSYELVGEQKDALYLELMEMISQKEDK